MEKRIRWLAKVTKILSVRTFQGAEDSSRKYGRLLQSKTWSGGLVAYKIDYIVNKRTISVSAFFDGNQSIRRLMG